MDPKKKEQKRQRRHKRTKHEIKGTKKRPRISVYRSNQHIYTQLVNDEEGETIANASDSEISEKPDAKTKKKFKSEFRDPKEAKKTFKAFRVGKLLAKKAKDEKIKKVLFDRSGYTYHGRIKALAEGAREGGLEF